MKLLLSLTSLFFSLSLFAYNDFNSKAFIVIYDDEMGGYVSKEMPYLGCTSMTIPSLAIVLTSPFIVPNIGCGNNGSENINELTCAQIILDNIDELLEGSTDVKGVTVDLSKCEMSPDSDPSNFQKATIDAVSRTFDIDIKNVKIK